MTALGGWTDPVVVRDTYEDAIVVEARAADHRGGTVRVTSYSGGLRTVPDYDVQRDGIAEDWQLHLMTPAQARSLGNALLLAAQEAAR